jgi:hypothetical protein
MPRHGLAGGARPPLHGSAPVRVSVWQGDLAEDHVDHAVEDVVLARHVMVERHGLDPSASTTLRMVTATTPPSSATRMAALSTRARLKGGVGEVHADNVRTGRRYPRAGRCEQKASKGHFASLTWLLEVPDIG